MTSHANVIVSRLSIRHNCACADEAMMPELRRSNGVLADVASGYKCQRLEIANTEGVWACKQLGRQRAPRGSRRRARRGVRASGRRLHVSEWEQWMCAAVALVDTVVAETPVALVA